MTMNAKNLLIAVLLLVGAGCAKAPGASITNFEECAAAGNPVMESYPRQCRANGQTYVEIVAAPAEPLPPGTPDGIVLTPAAEYGKTFLIIDGEAHVFPDGLQVTLMNIDDSRCPEDVQCVWAGGLSPVLSVMLLDQPEPPVEVRLGTTTKKEAQALGRTFVLNAASEDTATVTVTK